MGVWHIENMSPLKSQLRPTAGMVVCRLLVLKHVVAYGLAAPRRDLIKKWSTEWSAEKWSEFQRQGEVRRDEICQKLRKVGLWEHMSPREQGYSQSTLVTMTEREQIKASWRMEAVQILLWALGILPKLPPYDTMADPELLKSPSPTEAATYLQTPTLREPAVIDQARDAAEAWHWRSRTRELIERGDTFPNDPRMAARGFRSFDDVVRFSARNHVKAGTLTHCIEEDFPAKGKAYRDLTDLEWAEVKSITIERHYTLNWLCGYAPENRWDETPTGT